MVFGRFSHGFWAPASGCLPRIREKGRAREPLASRRAKAVKNIGVAALWRPEIAFFGLFTGVFYVFLHPFFMPNASIRCVGRAIWL